MSESITLNPSYLKNLPTYLRHDDFVDGQIPRLVKYLIQHQTEKIKATDTSGKDIASTLYNIRKERLANKNLCEIVLCAWLSYLSQEISRGGLDDDPWPQILNDLDGMGTPLDIFVRDLFWDLLGFGLVGVLTEGPSEVAERKTEAMARGEQSFSTLYNPIFIPHYAYWTDGALRGKLKEVCLFETPRREKPGDRDSKMVIRKLWIEEQGGNYYSQTLVQKKAKNILDYATGNTSYAELLRQFGKPIEFEAEEAISGEFDYIPFQLIGYGPSESVIKDTVAKNHELLNKKSGFDTINYAQAFKKLIGFGVKAEDVNTMNEFIMGLVSDPNARVQEIEPGNPVVLKQDLDDIARDAILAGLMRYNTLHQLDTKQVSSAEAKKADNLYFVKMLGYYADIVERSLQDIVSTHWHFENSTRPDSDEMKVQIARDFNVGMTQEENQEEAAVYTWLKDFGDAGHDVRKEIICRKIAEMRFAADDRESEDELKTSLIEAIRNATREANPFGNSPFSPRLDISKELGANAEPDSEADEE